VANHQTLFDRYDEVTRALAGQFAKNFDMDFSDSYHAAQIAFWRAVETHDEERGTFLPYMARVVSNALADAARAKKARVPIHSVYVNPWDDFDKAEAFEMFMASLSDEAREFAVQILDGEEIDAPAEIKSEIAAAIEEYIL